MPDRGLLVLSLASLVVGAAYFLFPGMLLRMSQALHRMASRASDQQPRYRYLTGLFFFGTSYGLFKLALLVGENPLHLLVPFR